MGVTYMLLVSTSVAYLITKRTILGIVNDPPTLIKSHFFVSPKVLLLALLTPHVSTTTPILLVVEFGLQESSFLIGS